MNDPRHALDLDHEAVSLLVRRPDGWREMGSVRLDDPDRDAAFADLRARAAAELPEGARVPVRLVIPDSQILYLTVEAPGADPAERLAATEAALEERTGHDVSELAFDLQDGTGDARLLAVVARETLAEADGFAAAHGFAPLCHVGRPGPAAGFRAEPYFGTAETAADLLPEGETPGRGGPPIRVVGPDAGPPPALPVFQPSAPRDVDDPMAPAARLGATASRLSFGAAADLPPPSADPSPVAPPLFVARRDPEGPRAPGDLPAPARPMADADPDGGGLPAFLPPRPDSTPEGDDAVPVTTPRLARSGDPAPAPADDADEADEADEAEPSFLVELRRRREEARAAPAPSRPVAVPPAPAPLPRDEAEAMTIFGARDFEEPSRWPAAAALALAVVLVVSALAGGTWWAWRSLMEGDPLADVPEAAAPVILAADPAPEEEGSAAPAPVVIAAPEPGPVTPATVDAPADATVDAPVDAAAPTPGEVEPAAQPPAELERPRLATVDIAPPAPFPSAIETAATESDPGEADARASYAATGIWQLAPRALPDPAGVGGPVRLPGAAEGAPSAGPVPGAPGNVPAEAAPILVSFPPTGPDIVFELDERGLVTATPEGTLAPGQVTVFAAQPPRRPPERPPSPAPAGAARPDLRLAGARPSARPAPAGAAVLPNGVAAAIPADEGSGPQVAEAEALAAAAASAILGGATPATAPAEGPGAAGTSGGTAEASGAADLVFGTEGRPPARGGATAEAAPQPETGLVTGLVFGPDIVAGRPAGRPGAATAGERSVDSEGIESALAAASVAAAGASLFRPEDAQAALEEEVPGASVYAVVRSLRPGDRPSGLASRATSIREARAEQERAASPPTQAAPSSAPAIPTSASVARTATQDNAIRLRRVNLIGVYGSTAQPRALVRLPSGRYERVRVGDRLDGGRVQAIQGDRLQYVRGGRAVVIEVPGS
ncbi:hypothetical protein BCF33_0359 [Hasllibacter halocynthiae]|uniref:Type IV pilus biogenesis protein PilP n=1 Tax=Hasllibacter halocynthiae TaxID=595589 RepID=A0A2T0X725_9RHOB|nr:hypothetical protein [Hasllibacter halocynthiae]PRY94761.1 hypothetical protein BCF33_0359 [Hasllibacter halocynthiae]